MKAMYPGFYSTSDLELKEIWSSNATLFVFDTNCLLNLYRCEDHTREEILNVMRALAPRTWIPFQVGLEYQRNRRSVIAESISSLTKIQEGLRSIYAQNILSHGSIKKHLYNSLNDEISELQLLIKNPIEEYIANKITPRIESKKSISNHDFIREEIDSIISDNVGTLPTQDCINAIDSDGESRYANKIPPGYKDIKKKDISHFAGVQFQDKFGDLYLWKEIIEKAKSDKIKNVIFICDDIKEDWWFEYEGRTHGPLEALKTEICNKSKINNFKLASQSTFLHDAKTYLQDVNVSDSSLKEVENLSKNNKTHYLTKIYFGDKEIHNSSSTLLKNLFKNLSYDVDESILNNYIDHNHDDHSSANNRIGRLLMIYENTARVASEIISELRTKRLALVKIVDIDDYIGCKMDINNALKDASETADDIRSLIIDENHGNGDLEYISYMTESFYFKVTELERTISNAQKLLSNLS
ncbi:TPA: hypothetical protein MAK88_002726 [Klebsiella aerogenes]|uniref:PIN domain-containing protein n=1 Tax=Klebsiella aerogenes TaxID=548 RepID=UPI00295D2ACE|nr:hypothetical protein [Klebsiella aerogenes]HBS5870750.1 hypothetical protein [Klebsiella aerogenes]